MQELVTQAEFARMRGVSRVAVGKWLASGRISAVERDGRRMIDPVAAAIELKGSEQRAQAVAALLQPPAATSSSKTLTDLKSETERERSALLRLERLEREGVLVPRDQVQLEQETAARIVRKALDAIPSRAEDINAAALAGGTLAVRKALKDLMRDVQESMARAMSEAAAAIEAQRASDGDDDADAA